MSSGKQVLHLSSGISFALIVGSGESKLDHISTAQEMARKAEQLEHSGHAATPESGFAPVALLLLSCVRSP